MKERMTLEEYKEKIREFLIRQISEYDADDKMRTCAVGIEQCYEDDIDPESTGAGLIRNFV